MPAKKPPAHHARTGRRPGADAAGRPVKSLPEATVHPLEGLPSVVIPDPPLVLKEAGRLMWDRLWRHLNYLDRVADVAAVARYCTLEDRIERWTAQIDADGDTTAGSTGQLRSHPLINPRAVAEKEQRALEATLGLSPEARAMLGVAAARIAESALDEMIRRRASGR